MYFLQKAQQLYLSKPQNNLSPLFADAQGKDSEGLDSFNAIVPSIEHSLGELAACSACSTLILRGIGRLMYTTGDTEGAVHYFLRLLRGSPLPLSGPEPTMNGHIPMAEHEDSVDKVFLEDFRVAFQVNLLSLSTKTTVD